MRQVRRIIPNFADGMEAGALWRLCASSREANHRSVFLLPLHRRNTEAVSVNGG